MGGRFTLSDDSHGIEQVGLNYVKTLACVQEAGITELCYLAPTAESESPIEVRFPSVQWSRVSVSELKSHAFWTK